MLKRVQTTEQIREETNNGTVDRQQFIYSFLSNPGRRKNTVRLSTSRKWRRAKLPDPGDGPRPFRVSKATSCFSRPLSHLCLSNPASRSIVAFDGAPILPELRWKRPPPPLPPLADLSSLFVDSVYTRAHPLYFPPLPSPRLTCKWIHHRVAFNRISGVANNVHDDDHRIVCFDQSNGGWKYIKEALRESRLGLLDLTGEEG